MTAVTGLSYIDKLVTVLPPIQKVKKIKIIIKSKPKILILLLYEKPTIESTHGTASINTSKKRHYTVFL